MTDDQVEADALQCWDLWRTLSREEGRNAEFVPNLEVWVVAYMAGVALGREIEQEACAALADGCGQANLAELIRAREDDDDVEDDDA